MVHGSQSRVSPNVCAIVYELKRLLTNAKSRAAQERGIPTHQIKACAIIRHVHEVVRLPNSGNRARNSQQLRDQLGAAL